MSCRRHLIYVVFDEEKYLIGASPDPALDLAYYSERDGYKEIAYVSPPLPLAVAEYLTGLISTPAERRGTPYRKSLRGRISTNPFYDVRRIVERKFRCVSSELSRLGEPCDQKGPIYPMVSLSLINYSPLSQYDEMIEHVLQGHIYYLHELEQRLAASGCLVPDLEKVMHLMVLQGRVFTHAGISMDHDLRLRCTRCGQEHTIKRFFCEEGQRKCFYCTGCLMMGKSRPCQTLFAAPAVTGRENYLVRSVRLSLDMSFTAPQYEAFEGLARFVRRDTMSDCMVWSACGASVPEVSFGAIREVLKRGGRVLFGVPRKEMLDDLHNRLSDAFPGVRIERHYGKSRETHRADIVVASVTQVLKYYGSFDLVLLDETDLLPYSSNEMMVHSLLRARKPGGKFIYLTSTPAPLMFRQAQRGQVKLFMIPARYHGHPLAVPEVRIEREALYDARLSRSFAECLVQTLAEDRAGLLIIAPNGDVSRQIGEYLKTSGVSSGLVTVRPDDVEYTFASDPERDVKIRRWVRGDFPILVTTNLTRRGDAVPRCNLVVFNADHEAFTEPFLMQLAQRVGWTDNYPDGRVWFLAAGMSEEMDGCIRKIRLLNEEATKRGFLDMIRIRKHNIEQ